MKAQFLLIYIFLFFGIQSSFAQISEEERYMNAGNNNALVLEIPDADDKLVEKLWKKYMKQYKGKTKKVKKADEYLTDDAKIAVLGSNTVDVYSNVEERGSNAFLTMWVDLGGSYVNSFDHPDKYNECEKILMRFAIEVAKEQTRQELAGEEKRLKKVYATLKKLEKDNDRYHKEIENAKARIQRAEENIVKNLQDQEETQKNIEVQEEVVDEVRKRLADL